MKKVQMVCILSGSMLFLSACARSAGRFDLSSVVQQGEADLVCETVLEGFETNDSKKIKELFSEKTIKAANDLEDGISENIALYEDSDFTYECLGNSVREHFAKDNDRCEITGTYVLTDDKDDQVLLWFVYCSVNEQDPDEEGVSLLILTDYTGIERNRKLEEILAYEKEGIYWSGWDESAGVPVYLGQEFM